MLFASLLACSARSSTFIQITDIQLDRNYRLGSEVSYHCHRSTAGIAGPCGTRDIRCHSPQRLLDGLSLELARWNPIPKFVLWTGNSVRADDDKRMPLSAEEHWEALSKVSGDVGAAAKRVPLIPTLGALDVFPEYQLAGDVPVALRNLSSLWADFIPPQERDTFRTLGCFLKVIGGSSEPAVAVLSINTVYFASKNKLVESCSRSVSPGAKVLSWLRKTLIDVRSAGYRAILAGHFPPDPLVWRSSCVEGYTKVANAFADVIAAHIFGGTHRDEFRGIPDLSSTTNASIAMAVCAPSVVPNFNPAFRVFDLLPNAPSTKQVVGSYRQYVSSLEVCAESERTSWSIEYASIAAPPDGLALPDLSGPSFDAFTLRLATDSTFAKLYHRFQVVSSSVDQPTVAPAPQSRIGLALAVGLAVMTGAALLLALWLLRPVWAVPTYEEEVFQALSKH